MDLEYSNWVNNEYFQWGNELSNYINNDSFNDFKSGKAVKRMVGTDSLEGLFYPTDSELPWGEIENLDKIGNPQQVEIVYEKYKISTITLRYVYYAIKIIELVKKLNNIKIVEIGGGYGGFCSVLNCVAKSKGISIDEYAIYDLPSVQNFQKYYLGKSVEKSSPGIKYINFLDSSNLDSFSGEYTYFVSFYALGEFDLPVKYDYINKVISKIKNGFILWNPHRNRDENGEKLLYKFHPNLKITTEYPLTSPYNMEIII
jgi:putative sugar O-methyltransferase